MSCRIETTDINSLLAVLELLLSLSAFHDRSLSEETVALKMPVRIASPTRLVIFKPVYDGLEYWLLGALSETLRNGQDEPNFQRAGLSSKPFRNIVNEAM